MTYKVYHFRLPVTLFVVSSTVFGHGYVFMRVSSWWRAVSEHCVYAAGKCHPSLARAFTQVPEHSLVQSSRLTFFSVMTGSSGKGLQIIFPWKIHPYFLKNNNIYLREKNAHSHWPHVYLSSHCCSEVWGHIEMSSFLKWKCVCFTMKEH